MVFVILHRKKIFLLLVAVVGETYLLRPVIVYERYRRYISIFFLVTHSFWSVNVGSSSFLS